MVLFPHVTLRGSHTPLVTMLVITALETVVPGSQGPFLFIVVSGEGFSHEKDSVGVY